MQICLNFAMVLLLLTASAGVAQAAELPPALATAIKDNGFNDQGVGLYIQEVTAAQPLAALHADQFLSPASVAKLLTTAAALDVLGEGFRWSTTVSFDGTLDGDKLKGNVYFHGNGDPYMTPERFWLLLNRVAIYGIRQIDGDVFFDDSYFQPDKIDYGAFDDQPYRSYNVGPNAVLIGFQATEFHFAANGHDNGAPVQITPFPDSPKMQIVNNVRLVDGNCGAWEKGVNLDVKTVADRLQVIFSGRFARDCGKRTLYRRVMETSDHFQHFFLPLWGQLGGTVSGRVRNGTVPARSTVVVDEPSITLGEAIRLINKYSNNVMTQQVLLTLGAVDGGPPGTTAKGLAAVKAWLASRHLDDPGLKLDNGAGLSRDTRVSAALLGRLLLYVFNQPYMAEFVASLPVTGNDGSMARRFAGEPLAAHGHIKTGLLDFVQSMAGYVDAASGKRYVVVLLHNDPLAHTRASEKMQDAVLRWVYQQ